MLSLAKPRIILMIGDDGVVVVPDRIPAAIPFFVPSENRHSAQEVVEFIARHPRARITLFADNLAQDYRHDTMPRLNFIDRSRLLRRRLKQYFPAARLTASLRLKGRDKNLMIGLHESNPVFNWAERLRMRLPDIALLPVEGMPVAGKLMPEAALGWAMMVSRHKSGGFRQIVTYDGELVFTRLTPLPDTRGGDAEAIDRDIKASLDYLGRHGLRNARELAVLILMPDEIHKSRIFENLPVRSLHSLSPHIAARKLGLAFAPRENDNAGDLLFAATLLDRGRPRLSLMLPETRQNMRTRFIRQAGLALASIALVIALSFAAWQANDFAATLMETRRTEAALEQTGKELAQAQAEAAPVTEPLGRLRQAVERRRIYAQATPTPWQALNELSGGAGDEARIIKLQWKKETDVAPDSLLIGLRMIKKTSDTADNDRADSVAAFSRLSQNIARAMPDYEVAAIEPPYPALPQESVSAEAQGKADAPTGSITLRKKMP
jgi:hypothetical protein